MNQEHGLQGEVDAATQRSHLTFPVVGIGASAGGISALQRMFSAMPAHPGMAFVIVVHLSPDHESNLDSILQRTTDMPVLVVTDAVPIQADHVYVIARSKTLLMSDGYLKVTTLAQAEARHASIDLFFRSLGQAHQERAICVVLSGTGADGTQGLSRVKELGGITIAQTPSDAEYDGMPQSAIDTGSVDLVLPANEIAGKLVALWTNVQKIALSSPPVDLEVLRAGPDAEHLAEEALLSIKALLRERTGHNFVHYKRATVLRRLERRMQVNAVPDLPTYRRFLEEHPTETPALLQDMLISVTNFYRDPHAFDALESSLARTLKGRPEGEPFRAWIAGCASGEEAYSVAILLHELFENRDVPIQVFASDIDQRAVAAARAGIYAQSIATDVPPSRLRRFFNAEPRGYRIGKAVRDSVIFSVHNVLSDPPFTRMDLICCRNLLIYLDRSAQAQLLRNFHFSLRPGGLLFLGSSETSDAVEGLFSGEDKRHRLFRADPAVAVRHASSVLPLPLLPRITAVWPVPPAPPGRPALEVLYERIVSGYAPATVLLDANDTILHVSDRASHFLRLPAGAPSSKLLELVRPELRVELRTALARAAEAGRSVQAPPVRMQVSGKTVQLHISVKPVTDAAVSGLLLVVFDESEDTLAEDGHTLTGSSPMLAALEAELLKYQALLRNTTGESAASTEELRASNEELQTINEELRSTTEELETSREELQSVNEELTTVNCELQLKIEETAKSNDDLQNLIVSSEIGTVFVDQGLRIKRFTPQAAMLFNLLPSDAGRSLLDITHRLAYPTLADDVAEVLSTLLRTEREVPTVDGRWFLARVLPYRTSDDHIEGAILTFVDVTARRLAEEQLMLTEQRMRLVVESMRDYAIITLDLSGRITSWSPGAERVFGHRADEAIGQSIDLIFTPEEQRAGIAQEEMRAARDHGRAEVDRWHVRKDGGRIYCSGITTPLIEGGMVGFAKIARDLTDAELQQRQKDASLERERSERNRLEEASAMKDGFLAVVSHELKNPLAVIQMSAQVMAHLPQMRDDPRARHAAGAIKSAVDSQVKIIDDLLDLSRVNTGKVVLARAHISLNDLIQNIADAVVPQSSEKHHALTIDLGEPVSIFADPVRIEQIVWNLLTNAIKFTPDHGRVNVRLRVDGGHARLEVSDSGIGIAFNDREGVFEMFRQVEAGPNRRKTGLGIGLALSRQLAELHGGQVSVGSGGLNQGSTFVVLLPIDSTPGVQATTVNSPGGLAGLRILLLDDEPMMLMAFGELLRLEGAHVTAVDNGEAAIRAIQEGCFDIVVSDLSMPVHDGYWFIAAVKQHQLGRSAKFIALSGMARGADRARALAAGFDAHLGKPVALAAFSEVVVQLMDALPS